MGLADEDEADPLPEASLPPPVAREDILRELERRQAEEKPVLSLVVVGACADCRSPAHGAGHVDAGKSTLMGRLLVELGEVTERAAANNKRQSEKIGKGSFAFAWQFDAMPEERERCVGFC